MKKLCIVRCPTHYYYAISIDDPDTGIGTRVTPSKCCGRWDTVKEFWLSEAQWENLSDLALEASIEEES